jgi:hypothetical protein
MKKKLIFLISACALVSGCMTYDPKPGMTVKQLDDMSVFSVNGHIEYVGEYHPVPGVTIYENWKQTRPRREGRMHPSDGEYYFFYNGRLVTKEWVKDQEIEEKKKQALAVQQQQKREKQRRIQLEQEAEQRRIQLEQEAEQQRIQMELENVKRSRPVLNSG